MPSSHGVLERRCHHIDEEPAFPRSKIKRLRLIESIDHIGSSDDDETLLVCSDWLVWQELMDTNRLAVHLQSGSLSWVPGDLERDVYLQCNDWAYSDGRDLTIFEGVSLGTKFLKNVYGIISDFERVSAYLSSLVDRFAPDEIEYVAVRTDYRDLRPSEYFYVVESFCRTRGLKFSDVRPDKLAVDRKRPSLIASRPTAAVVGANKILGFLGKLRILIRPKRARVLCMLTHLNSIPLIKGHRPREMTIGFLEGWFPKKRDFRFVSNTLLRGIVLVGARRPALSPSHQQEIQAIIDRVKNGWRAPTGAREFLIRRFLEEHVLVPEVMGEKARDVLWAKSVIEDFKPSVIVTDILQNGISRTFVELARKERIPCVSLWHAHYLFNSRQETFGCDPRVGRQAEKCFSWGRANEAWLDKIGATCEPIRTGSMIAGQYRKAAFRKKDRKRALVLQYPISKKDFRAPVAFEFTYFVEVVGMLQDLGYVDIRLRLHPNVKYKIPTYRAISSKYGIRCEISDDGPFADQVEWADFAIGPVSSGASLEIIAAGKPYFPVALRPTSMDLEYLEGFNVFTDFVSLRDALESGSDPDHEALLEAYTSLKEFPKPEQKVWDEIFEVVRNNEQ